MTLDAAGGCDTSAMGVIHATLRRDLDRAAVVLGSPAGLEEPRLRALGEHLEWVVDFLHEHHTGEDERLYPVARAKNPDAAELLDDMNADHERIHPAMDEVREASRAARSADRPAADRATTLAAAIAHLRAVLDPHLEREEREMMPVVAATLSQAEWDEYESGNVDMSDKKKLAFTGHWILDGLAPEKARIITATVPPVPRFILQNFLGGPYRKRRQELWGGTPAEAVRSVPLT